MQKKNKKRAGSRSSGASRRWYLRDQQKEAFWRNHVDKWKVSGQSKRGYSRAQNLSESSFSSWVRELALRDREGAPSTHDAVPSSQKEVTPFVPIRLLPDNVLEVEAPPQPGHSGNLNIEIQVPGGAVIRVGENCNVRIVAELFAFLRG